MARQKKVISYSPHIVAVTVVGNDKDCVHHEVLETVEVDDQQILRGVCSKCKQVREYRPSNQLVPFNSTFASDG